MNERPIKLATESKDREVYDVLVIDRSGSMGQGYNNTITGINNYIDNLKKDTEATGVKTYISIILFNDKIELLMNCEDIKEIPKFDKSNYIVSGTTALNDGVGAAIELLREKLKGREGDEDIDVSVTVFTDGEENSSVNYPRDNPYSSENKKLKDYIQELTESYKWTFSFIGAGTDKSVTAAAASFNIAPDNVVSYNMTSTNHDGLVATLSRMSYARSAKMMSFSSGIKSTDSYLNSSTVIPNQ